MELTCINCPLGCTLHVTMEDGIVRSVTGNTCGRGEAYARSEMTHPVRMVTASMPVQGGELAMVSCKTSQPVPKEKVFAVMDALKGVCIQAPVEIGDVLVRDAAKTGADIVATKKVKAV